MPSATEIVSYTGVSGSLGLLIIATIQLFVYERPAKEDVRKAVVDVAKKLPGSSSAGQSALVRDDIGSAEAQALVGETIKESFQGLSEFAKTLKELDTSTRLYLIAVAFLLIALAAATEPFSSSSRDEQAEGAAGPLPGGVRTGVSGAR